MNSKRRQLVCRTCLKIICENELYVTAESKIGHGRVIDILETCVSELNLDLTCDIVVCENCIRMLRISYEFKLKCLHTEDKVFAYFQKNNLQLFNRINLVDLINSMTDVNLKNDYRINVETKHTRTNMDEYFLSRDENCDNVTFNPLNKYNGTHYIGDSNGQNRQITNVNKPENCQRIIRSSGDVVMFEDVTKCNDDCEIVAIDYLTDTSTQQNCLSKRNTTEQFSYFSRESGNWEMNLDRCRLNSCKEEYSDSLFRISPVQLCDDDDLENYIFRPPSPLP